jgi:hypothetical protein
LPEEINSTGCITSGMNNREAPQPDDPAEIVDSLDPGAILDRMSAISAEHQALRVLLKAALARKRGYRHRCSKETSAPPRRDDDGE